MAKQEVEPLSWELADWFLKQGDRICGYDEIGDMILAIRKNRLLHSKKIDQAGVAAFCSETRRRLEDQYNVTLWNVSKIGYRISNDQDYAMFTVGRISAAYCRALRANRLLPGMTEKRRKHLPEAVAHYFPGAIRGTKRYITEGRDFIKGVLEFRKIENSDGKEEKGNGKHDKNGN